MRDGWGRTVVLALALALAPTLARADDGLTIDNFLILST